jgi:ABC-type transport system involved in multi-copper enzyme maturation permease subunit
MSMTTTSPAGIGPQKQLPPGRYSIRDQMRSEWTKLVSVRSTMWTLGLTIVIGIGVSAIAAAETRSHWNSTQHFGFDPTSLSLTGVFIAQLIIGVLGVMVMSAEYGTGTIRATLSATPRRPGVLVAKASVFGFVALVVSMVTAFLSFFVGQALLASPAVHATLSSPDALREVLGTGIFLFLIGLFALAIATLIRHTAGSISTFVGVLLVLPSVLRALPNSIYNDIDRFLPSRIGITVLSRGPQPNVFSAWVGLAVMAGYTLALLIIGGVQMTKRDA